MKFAEGDNLMGMCVCVGDSQYKYAFERIKKGLDE